jgi:hypothetical protein
MSVDETITMSVDSDSHIDIFRRVFELGRWRYPFTADVGG